MNDALPAKPARKPRADSVRNRERVLEAAKAVFAEGGPAGSLEGVARQAGVGVGTLYRHFPTRPDLIAAVFSQEIDACADAAERLAKDHPAFDALRLWMREFVALVTTKRGLAQVPRPSSRWRKTATADCSRHSDGCSTPLDPPVTSAGTSAPTTFSTPRPAYACRPRPGPSRRLPS